MRESTKKDIRGLWYLRGEDFRPEELTESALKRFCPDKERAVELLMESNNLFESREDAIEGSMAVRAELARLSTLQKERREYSLRLEILSRNTLSSGQGDRQNETKEILRRLDLLLSHTSQNVSDRTHCNSPANDPESH